MSRAEVLQTPPQHAKQGSSDDCHHNSEKVRSQKWIGSMESNLRLFEEIRRMAGTKLDALAFYREGQVQQYQGGFAG